MYGTVLVSKGTASSTLSEEKPKCVTKSMCLEIQLNIIKWPEGGEGVSTIARAFTAKLLNNTSPLPQRRRVFVLGIIDDKVGFHAVSERVQ